MRNKISYSTIIAAHNGDSEAIQSILRHYSSYIMHFAKRKVTDNYGNSYEIVDEELAERIKTKLMIEIVMHFDPCRLPKGMKLEDS